MTTAVSSCPPVPAEVTAWVATGRAVVAIAERADVWDAGVRRAVLGEFDRVERLVAAARSRVVTAEREAGTWSLRGDRDLAGFVGRESHQGRGAGMAAVGQAATLAAMPTVAEALMDGPVTTKHVAEITRAAANSPALAAELATPEGQASVVELASRLDGGQFGKALAQLGASLDPAQRQRSHDEQRANRSFTWTHTPSGTLIKGQLDSVAGHKLAKAIEALCPRPALDDERNREQRRADGLMAIVERAATDRATTPGALAPVQAIVTFSQETWAALRAASGRGVPATMPGGADEAAVAPAGDATTTRATTRCADSPSPPDRTTSRSSSAAIAPGSASAASAPRSSPDENAPRSSPTAITPGSAIDVIDRLHGVAVVTDETGQAWPASEIARALCDCALTRSVAGAADTDLNLGRESRLFRRQHWMALYASGIRACVVPGCGMPLAYTELHHLRWWYQHGGRTDLANCLPYCSYHHHEIHRLGIVVTRLADGVVEHRYPDGRRYGAPPPDARGRPVPSETSPSPDGSPVGLAMASPGPGPGMGSRSESGSGLRLGPGRRLGPAPGPAPGPNDATGGGDPPRDLMELLIV